MLWGFSTTLIELKSVYFYFYYHLNVSGLVLELEYGHSRITDYLLIVGTLVHMYNEGSFCDPTRANLTLRHSGSSVYCILGVDYMLIISCNKMKAFSGSINGT